MTKKALIFSFFVLGLTSLLSQVMILRELTVSFYGNEFFIGLVLASWLAWVAVGSGLGGKLLNKIKETSGLLISLYFLVGLFFFLEIFLIRFLKGWIGMPGEIPNLIIAGLTALLTPAPLCLLLGLWWTCATRMFSQGKAQLVNRAYFIETLGFILGGILFSLFLVNLQFPWMANFQFKGQNLLESVNSPYGNIAVTKIGEQYNFYESGLLLGSEEEIQFSEDLIHLSLLQHPSPQKVLLIGNGFNGAVNEILKHQPEKIYYLELDPKLIELSQKYISQEFKEVLTHPAVKIINTDGRYFLQGTKEKFDAILLNLPDPSTALINRFYTQEFFEKAKEKLAPNGIFATYLTFSPSTPGKNLENLNASIFRTLKKVFNQVIVLPEETNFFLASQNENLTYNFEILIQRFEQRNIETKFLTKEYITYRLSNDRIEKTLALFEKNEKAKENKDFKPIAYFYQTLFWLDRFYPQFSNFFKQLVSAFWLVFAGALIFLTLLLLKRRKGWRKNFSLLSVAIAGFSLMALEIIIIFSYQITIGYLYYRIALLIAALMAGMALGVWYGNKKGRPHKVAPTFHLLLIMFCVILFLAFPFLSKIPSGLTAEIIFLICAGVAGFLGAAIFSFANQLYLSSQSDPHKKTGTIYAVDLAGSCFGALLPGLILIPVFGVFQTLIVIALANLWIVLIFLGFNTGDFSF